MFSKYIKITFSLLNILQRILWKTIFMLIIISSTEIYNFSLSKILNKENIIFLITFWQCKYLHTYMLCIYYSRDITACMHTNRNESIKFMLSVISIFCIRISN